MKFSLFTIVAGIASVVSAQAGAAEPPKWYAVYPLKRECHTDLSSAEPQS
jgi:hypothetical protein